MAPQRLPWKQPWYSAQLLVQGTECNPLNPSDKNAKQLG